MKIAITGKMGLLSQEIQKLVPDIIVLDSKNFNVAKRNIVDKLKKIDPDIIIHAGAITDSTFIINNSSKAISTNIIGTAHISNYCIKYTKRLVYISTDYVYDGKMGNFKETDNILPYNEYAWTKLGGECSVKLVPDHLIIRTSFGNSKFPYKEAWDNQKVSKDYVDIIAPMILKAAKSDVQDILNIGTESKTVFEYAQKRNIVRPINKSTKTDFTLNTEKYEQALLY